LLYYEKVETTIAFGAEALRFVGAFGSSAATAPTPAVDRPSSL